jgi:hypothetical protein
MPSSNPTAHFSHAGDALAWSGGGAARGRSAAREVVPDGVVALMGTSPIRNAATRATSGRKFHRHFYG